MRKYLVPILSLIVIVAVGFYGYSVWQEKTRLPVMKNVGDFTLQNLDGTPYHFKDTDGKVRLVSFIFTNCVDVCPVTTHYMAKIQDKLKAKNLYGKEVEFVTITFDPERDTPEVLKEYAGRFGADMSGWHFLRGEDAAIQQVASAFGIGYMKQDDGTYVHTMKTFLIDKEKNMRKMYGMGADMNLDEIVTDMEGLAKE